jgi:DNA-binding beta-propeller fold protein YncE
VGKSAFDTRGWQIAGVVFVVALGLCACGSYVATAGTASAQNARDVVTSAPKAVATSVDVGGFPTGIAVDTETGTVYVASGNANALSLFNADTCNASTTKGCASVESAPTGGQDPIGVVVDQRTQTIYAVNGGSDTVAVINAATCNASDTRGCDRTPALVNVPGGPEFLALNSLTNTIYVADTNSGDVSVIDGITCDARSTIGCTHTPASVSVGSEAFPIAVDQATNSIYVGTGEGVSVINGSSCDSSTVRGCSKAPALISVDNQPAGLAVDDQNHTVYESGEGGTVAVIDTGTCNGTDANGCANTSRLVQVQSDPRGDAVDPATNTIYVTNAGSDSVSMLDAATCGSSTASGCRSVGPAFPVGSSPRRVAVDSENGTLYVVNVLGNTVSVINAQSCNATVRSGCPTRGSGGEANNRGSSPLGLGQRGRDSSNCSPTSGWASDGSGSTLSAKATQVASGQVNGLDWSLWSEKGQLGATALEEGALVVDGRAYGLCPGYPNPVELEMLDVGSNAIVYGVVGYPGLAKIDLSVGSVGTFEIGKPLPSPNARVVNGVSFFIGGLPKSACDYSSLEMNTTSAGVSAEHNLGFAGCVENQLVPITASQGVWGLAPGQFSSGF